MSNKIKILLVLAVLFILIGVGLYFLIISKEKVPSPQAIPPEYPEVPGQREKEKEGPLGDFEIQISLEREGDKVILDWQENTKVYEILVASLGFDYTDKDNKLVWRIISQSPEAIKNNPKTIPSAEDLNKALENRPAILPLYELLTIPQGFQLLAGSQEGFQLEKGSRYSVELRGEGKIGAYIFVY